MLIGGGSLSALAAALTLGNLTNTEEDEKKVRIAYLEITDWPGGQLTSSLVPPDFGPLNEAAENLPASFVDLLLAVGSIDGEWESNPGECWVSTKCFSSKLGVEYIMGLLNSYPNVDVYLNTAIKSVQTNGHSKVTEVQAIQRTKRSRGNNYNDNYNDNGNSKNDDDEYIQLLSKALEDWYNPIPSEEFEKSVLSFSADVFIEGTEFGDILMNTASVMGLEEDLAVSGYEQPYELSEHYVSNCGQSSVFPFVLSYSNDSESNIDEINRQNGNFVKHDDEYSFGTSNWSDIWAYRRIDTGVGLDGEKCSEGQQSNQNWDGGNDYTGNYIFLSIEDCFKQIKSSSGWAGCINIEALKGMEEHAYGWMNYFVTHADKETQQRLSVNTTQTMTRHGLSKMPYIRDTRRSKRGIDGFRLSYAEGLNVSAADCTTSIRYNDTVAIGNYIYLDVHELNVNDACPGVSSYPDYLSQVDMSWGGLLPYYIPFRALTSQHLDNVLISGKGMAQTFMANAGTRFHPTEWSTGVAAGAAAFIMSTETKTVRDVYEYDIKRLQNILEERLRSPLTWSICAST